MKTHIRSNATYFWAKNLGEVVYKDGTTNNESTAGEEIFLLASLEEIQELKDAGQFDDLPDVVVP